MGDARPALAARGDDALASRALASLATGLGARVDAVRSGAITGLEALGGARAAALLTDHLEREVVDDVRRLAQATLERLHAERDERPASGP